MQYLIVKYEEVYVKLKALHDKIPVIQLNSIDFYGKTAFHLACCNGLLQVADIIIQKSPEFDIDLNAKDRWEQTAFIWAAKKGQSRIAQMLTEKSVEFKIDLLAKDSWGRTGFHYVS